MSKNRYSRTEMYKLAESLTMDELERNMVIANQESHLCNHCFNCVCKEVYLNFKVVNELAFDIALDKVIIFADWYKECGIGYE